MKVEKEREDYRGLKASELQEKIENLRRELFSLRLNASTAHVKDYSQLSKLRKSIARALTCLSEKQSQA
jgi:large subunit ribosomal protein L29